MLCFRLGKQNGEGIRYEMNSSHLSTIPDTLFSTRQRVGLWLVSMGAVWLSMVLVGWVQQEVAPYHVNTFEPRARQALAAGEFRRALRICTGALESDTFGRSDHIGEAHLLRAKAYWAMGVPSDALADLEACAARWRDAPWDASGNDRGEVRAFGVELALALSAARPADALRALSAAARGSGEFADYLHQLNAELPDAVKRILWPEEPYLVVEDFETADVKPFVPLLETRGRTLFSSRLDETVAWKGRRSAAVDVGDPLREGESYYGTAVHIALSERPFALRLWMRERRPSSTHVRLAYWVETAQTSAGTVDGAACEIGEGWKLFDIRRDFHRERLAWAAKGHYDADGGLISSIMLAVEGGANTFWIDRIEVYLPATDSVPGGE